MQRTPRLRLGSNPGVTGAGSLIRNVSMLHAHGVPVRNVSRLHRKVSALRFDTSATYELDIMPLCCITWSDEHPAHPMGGTRIACQREDCRDSLIRLSNARMQLWLTGRIPEDLQPLWNQAQQLLPEWPGFRRLKITDAERQSLSGCAAELDDLMEAIRKDFPHIAVEDKGGGVAPFRAWRDVAPKRKPWWRFW